MKIRAQITMVLNLDKCHRVPHLFGHLQERVDEQARHGVHLVQQR